MARSIENKEYRIEAIPEGKEDYPQSIEAFPRWRGIAFECREIASICQVSVSMWRGFTSICRGITSRL